ILAALAPLLLRLAPGRGLTRSGRGRCRHVAVEARLLLVVERAVEGRERGLDRVEGRERGVDPLLHRLEPRRRRRGHVLRAVGGEALGRLLGALAQRRERGALLLVGADGLRDGVERPGLELGALLAAAADELPDQGAERPAAAAQHGIAAVGPAPPRPILALAGAPPILIAATPLFIAGAPPVVIAATPAVVGLAGTIFAAIASEVLPEILGVAAAPPLVEGANAPAIAALARAIGAAILHAVLPAILVLILGLTLVLILSLILGLILPAALPAILSLTLGVAGAPPVVEARWAALAVAVIAVMAAAGVGARGHAHHQHRRKQHGRLQHGSRPRWSSPMTTREPPFGFAACHMRHPRA